MLLLTRIQRLRIKLVEATRLTDAQTILLWAALAGVVGALATMAFRESIRGLQWLVSGQSGSLVEMAKSLPWYLRLAFPAAGGVIAGVFLEWARRGASGKSNSDYMEAISIGDGRIHVRESIARSISSLFSVSSGGSIGREGSMVQLAATCASIIGRLAKFNPGRLRLLVACGAAAGITSAYNAPIAGALFVAEIVIGSISMESFGPLLVASVVANITMREFAGYQPVYEMPPFPGVPGGEMVLFIGLGIVAGVLATQFLRVLAAAKKAFGRMHGSLPLRLGVGGLIVGVLSIRVPEVWGNGYSVVNSLLHTPWPWAALLLTLVFKIAATASTTGSGAVGGVFTPTLFVGAVLGNLYGLAMHAIVPSMATSQPFAYAIVGMGAFLAASAQAPLMAILMIFEMTLSYQVVLPLMVAVVAAYVAARSGSGTSMYAVTRRNNATERMWTMWHGLRIKDLVKPAAPVLPLSASLEDVAKAFVEHPVKFVYFVDAHNRFSGIVSLQQLKPYMLQHGAPPPPLASLLQQQFPRLTPDMPLGDALQQFLTHPGERLPVVQSLDDQHLLGVVSKTDLLLRIQEIAH